MAEDNPKVDEIQTRLSKNRKVVAGQRLMGFIALSAGTYHGYCDANHIPIQTESLEFLLTAGPTFLNAGYIGLIGIGLSKELQKSNPELASDGGLSDFIGATVGTIGGGVVGGIQTLVGYGIGYVAGYLLTKTQ
jgi:hypothetical protein